MKSNAMPKGFPVSPEEWEKLVAKALGEDRSASLKEEETFWQNAVVIKEGGYNTVRAALAEKRKLRGTQNDLKSIPVTIRFDADVLAALKASGKGWQTRVNALVRAWLESERTSRPGA
jgi:uncharacterized protein (DUF4415 family)